jgi:fluoroquinolone resistance protein
MGKLVKPSETISNINFTLQVTEREDYENCEFVNCIFSDISQLNFIECTFRSCNLSNCKINNCKLQDVTFVDCKLLGINFFQAKDFAFALTCERCNLDYASFDSKKLNKSRFENCKMHSVNFTMTDLSKAELVNCDLYEAIFNNTNLNGVDLTTITNFSIDPELNKLKKAKFQAQDLEKLLYKYDLIIQ